MTTHRRDFLKAGALIAAPLAAIAAPAALAADPRLAALEDERAIAASLRAFLARFNADGLDACSEFCARPLRIRDSVKRIMLDSAEAPAITVQGGRALYQRSVELGTRYDFTGNSTLEKMARFQDSPRFAYPISRSMTAAFDRTAQGWKLSSLMFH